MHSTVNVSLGEKYGLSLDEAAVYFGISIEEIQRIVSGQDWCLMPSGLGGGQLIRRKAFESYLDSLCSTTCDHHAEVIQFGLQHLDNHTDLPDCAPLQQKEVEMATKINRAVTINGKKKWIRADTEQEYAEKLSKLFNAASSTENQPLFSDYAWTWYSVYSKPNIATATAVTYKRQLTRYLIPAFGEKRIKDITTDDIQSLFNSITGSKATKDKVKQVLGMILSMAMEDGLILKNPLNSKRLRVTGSPSEFTKVYTVEQMRFLVQNLDKVKDPADQTYLAIQALHPLRLEEVLGLKWEDIDFDNAVIHIRRAVTHPTRNQPEVKLPKTEASIRDIGLSSIAAKYLTPGKSSDFVFGGKTPLSYQRVKRMCNRIRVDTDFSERITPQRFRTTVLTDIYDATKDVKAAQAAAGHTTSAMTLKHYVKGRTNCNQTAAALDHVYCS